MERALGKALAFGAMHILRPILLCQLHTYWRHSIIATSMGGIVYGLDGSGLALNRSRFIEAKTVLKSTAIPLLMHSVAFDLAVFGRYEMSRPEDWATTKRTDCQSSWEPWSQTPWANLLALAGWWAFLYAVLVVPCLVVLIRVQVSMLPDGQRTVIPVDRTFGKQRDLNRGYLTAWEAFMSVSWSSWGRIYRVFGQAYAYAALRFLVAPILLPVLCLFFWGVLLLLNML